MASTELLSLPTQILCAAFREWRESAGLSQTLLAARLNRPQSFIAKVESPFRGKNRKLTVLETYEWAYACGVSWKKVGQVVERAVKAGGSMRDDEE